MNDAAVWTALQADGVTPSLALTVVNDPVLASGGSDGASAKLVTTSSVNGDRLRRSLPAVDLRPYEELRLSVRAPRPATGSAGSPFLMEIRLGNAAFPAGHPANTWHRFLPVARAEQWEVVRLSLRDLHPNVRSEASSVELRCLVPGLELSMNLDSLLAARAEMLSDLEAALLGELHEQLSMNGVAVPALLGVSGGTTAPPMPSFSIHHIDTRFADARSGASSQRSDFNSGGYRIAPGRFGYDISYAVECLADNRVDQARLLEFTLQRIPARGTLEVNGEAWSVEALYPSPRRRLGGAFSDRAIAYYRVFAYQDAGSTASVKPVDEVRVAVEQRAELAS